MMVGVAKEIRSSGSGNNQANLTRPTKLFIGGITRNTTTKQLRDHFEPYGRVLDCVAMRLADGRPRGFGYVTLDSPEAADSCLGVPQVIDGRVVDMKRAVPESDKSIATQERLHIPNGSNAATRPSYMPFANQSPQFPFSDISKPWKTLLNAPPSNIDYDVSISESSGQLFPPPACMLSSSWASPRTIGTTGPGMVDCLDLLSTIPAAQQAPVLESRIRTRNADPFPQLIPARADTVSSLASKEEVKAPGLQKRAVLGEITNLTRSEEKAKPIFDVMKVSLPTYSPLGSENSVVSMPPARTKPIVQLMDQIFEDESVALSPVQSDIPMLSPLGLDLEPIETSETIDMLPSVGSSEHAAGTCRRCNFFAKGRCQNGLNCTFCHLPHEKKKTSRQEKRERKAEWLEKNEASKAESLEPRSDDLQQAMAYSMMFGLPPMQSPALSRAGHDFRCLSTATPRALMPPPGLEDIPAVTSQATTHWQPEAEVSPVGSFAAVGPMPMLATVPQSTPSTIQQVPVPKNQGNHVVSMETLAFAKALARGK